jgi:hypothetical protein
VNANESRSHARKLRTRGLRRATPGQDRNHTDVFFLQAVEKADVTMPELAAELADAAASGTSALGAATGFQTHNVTRDNFRNSSGELAPKPKNSRYAGIIS